MAPLIYLDNNATTRPAREVVDAMQPFLQELWGNPSSRHTFGNQVGRHIEKTREQVARLVGAKRPSEILFTSSGSESNLTAIRSAVAADPHKRKIVTTAVEHPSVLMVMRELERQGYPVTYLAADAKGRLDFGMLEASLTPDTALVSIMWANNETGVIFPVGEIAKYCEALNIPLHVDAVQAAGKIPIDMSRMPVSYLSLSGHKFHAPKGVGALYIRRGTRFTPLFPGGHQEMGRRAGTENAASIAGMGKAAELALTSLSQQTSVGLLRDRLEVRIRTSIPDAVINGDHASRLPNTSNISFPGLEGEAILLLLNEHGICASTGSACTSGSMEPSHVLTAMGIQQHLAQGTIRLSLSRETTEAEIDEAAEKIVAVVKRLSA